MTNTPKPQANTLDEKITKKDIIGASEVVKHFLPQNEHTDVEIREFEEAISIVGEHPLVKKMIADNYDARATHPGFGSPNCSCHTNPPCQACVDWTNFCDEREEAVEVNKEPGCTIIEHGCDADGVA